MTTHRRGVLLQTGVVIALASVAMAAATPAQAAPGDEFSIAMVSGGADLQPGETADVTAKVTNHKDAPLDISVQFSLPGETTGDVAIVGRPSSCTGSQCTISFPKGDTNLTWRIGAMQNLPAGTNKSGNGKIKLTVNPDSREASFQVKVTGPTSAPTVPEVSGSVIDSTTGNPVPNATVTLLDGANQSQVIGTETSGRFTFTSRPGNPIVPGTLSLTPSNTRFQAGATKRIEGKAGQPVNVGALKLTPIVPTASVAVPSAEQVPVTTDPEVTTTTPADTITRKAATGLSTLSMGLITFGVLLVVFGIGAIVMLLMRRKDDGDDPEDDPSGGPGGPTAPPGSRGVYRGGDTAVRGAGDPTMTTRMGGVDEPTMAGAGNDATAVLRSPVSIGGATSNYGPDVSVNGYGRTPDGNGAAGNEAGQYGQPPRPAPPAAGGERPYIDWMKD